MRVPLSCTGVQIPLGLSSKESDRDCQGGGVNSHCDITINIKIKSKRSTKKYRAIQRPDGVVVEYPRYQPATSDQTPECQFKPHRAILICPNVFIREKEGTKPGKIVYQLVSDKTSGNNTGSGEHGGTIERGRGGYHDLAQQQIQTSTETHIPEGQDYIDMAVMDRFLREPGPWSPYSQREEQAKLE